MRVENATPAGPGCSEAEIRTLLLWPTRRRHAAFKTTRDSPALMPYGSFTTQLRRESSTCNSMTAWQAGWSIADSTNRKSGPICKIRNDVPSTNSFIRTSAECPPWELSILMAGDLFESACAFATRYDLRLCEPLGSGIHGSVHLVRATRPRP